MPDELTRRDFFKTLACAALASGAVLPIGFPRQWREFEIAYLFARPSPASAGELLLLAETKAMADLDLAGEVAGETLKLEAVYRPDKCAMQVNCTALVALR